MNLATFLRFLPASGPAVAALPAAKEFLDAAVKLLRPTDQPTAKTALEDLREDNDEGFARLDAKLAAAERA